MTALPSAARPPGAAYEHRIVDIDEAERVVSTLVAPHHLELRVAGPSIDMRFTDVQLGATSVARIAYRDKVQLVADQVDDYYVNLTTKGRAISSTHHLNVVSTRPGEAAVFSPHAPAAVTWLPESEQICVRFPHTALLTSLERLLGRSLQKSLQFRLLMDIRSYSAVPWGPLLALVRSQLEQPPGARHPAVGQHVEALLQDALLLAQPHTYTDELMRVSTVGGSAIRRAAELLHQAPDRPWSSVELAAQVHVSVRSLQEGFKREFDVSPMTYLRQIRLQRARDVLTISRAEDTSVAWVAEGLGFTHLPRFAAAYREAFGENPSATLRRPVS